MSIIRIIKKFRKILSTHQKVRIVQLGIMMVIGGMIETVSVSLILPFMNIIMEPEKTMEKWYAKLICNFFGLQSDRSFLVFIGTSLAAIYILKNVYLMFEYSFQYRFVYGNMFDMQKKLLRAFIHRPYEYFLKVNSGEIVRIINNDTSNAFNILTVLLNLFTELIVSVLLIISIFIITPAVTLCIAALLGVLLISIFHFIKPVLRKASLNVQKGSGGMNKWLLQSIQGIKEIKVMKEEEFFQKNYDKNGGLYVGAIRWNQTLSVAPRFIIEGVCMGTMFIVVSAMIYRGTELESIIPILTAVAMAAVRLLPSVNRISTALSSVAYGEPMLDKVIENLEMFNSNELSKKIELEQKNNNLSFENAIDFHEISFRYPDAEDDVLNKSSFTLKNGESIGLVGPSGAGKTTTVDIILGLLNPYSGNVLVDGIDISYNISGWLNNIGYIPQTIFMLDSSIRDNISFGENIDSDEDIWIALEEAAIDDFVKSLPDGLDTQIGERGVRLSGGQRQRIGIARALFRNPKVLIFDEATSALDNDTEAAIMDSINNLKGHKTMIIIAHRLSTIKGCDHIYRVENKRIVKER